MRWLEKLEAKFDEPIGSSTQMINELMLFERAYGQNRFVLVTEIQNIDVFLKKEIRTATDYAEAKTFCREILTIP